MGVNSRHSRLYKTIQDKDYVQVSQKRLVPTEKGTRLCSFLSTHFADIMAYDYTARLEDQLDLIASGDSSRLDVLRSFWEGFQPQVVKATEYAFAQLRGRHTPKPLMLHPVQE